MSEGAADRAAVATVDRVNVGEEEEVVAATASAVMAAVV